MAIVFIGTSFESKMQIGLLVILALSIIDYFVGTFVPVSENQLYRGITGYSCKFYFPFCISFSLTCFLTYYKRTFSFS